MDEGVSIVVNAGVPEGKPVNMNVGVLVDVSASVSTNV
eukprot:CAMPEP_0184340050 /NCGR_PEP_ID=MMETSP1089-20130417/8710_1 /TAXON_ID=38269 ORGANISM="Gloeochaete wittrockiana, Strain SAG46.84" /NCGR_SAMPLE_ID=MMETSP1089 /ASSEMBLY_ACC=CAM_ASM_000445 /LENGTH=37 /DNA_ID= /DNA_START= /DNA_END= /DNA_ORIENTATION=